MEEGEMIMGNKKFAVKKRLLSILLSIVLALTTIGVLSPQLVERVYAYAPERTPVREYGSDENPRGGYTLDEIREMLQQDDAYGFKRVYHEDRGPKTYPLSADETIDVFGAPMSDYAIQPIDFTYERRAVFGEGRPCAESIVLVLLGDGFTAGNAQGDVGHWPNPSVGTFLHSAQEFAITLTNTYPFNLFSDIFKIYAIETPSSVRGIREGSETNPIDAPYAGTYLGSFFTVPGSLGIRMQRSAHALAISRWASSNSIMTQAILNTTTFGGVAFGAGSGYFNNNSLGITARSPGTFWHWNRPNYHYIVVHEIGHNFGRLTDEHSTGSTSLGRANVALATDTDAQLKWGHMLGHGGIIRRTVNAPAGFIFPSTNNTCLMQGWHATFCIVCSAELTRRMAIISGETFEVGRRPDGTSRTVIANFTVPAHQNRILPYAFHGNTTINTIHIPSSVTDIGDFAFTGATDLRTIVNHSTNPPLLNERTFAGVIRESIDVWIPSGTRSAYISAGWGNFNLIEMCSTITDINASSAHIPPEGGSSTIVATGSGINQSQIRIAAFLNTGNALYMQQPTGTASSVSAVLIFPENTGNIDRVYTIKVSLDGGSTWLPSPIATVTVNALINISTINDGDSGRGWSFSSPILRIEDGADVIVTGEVLNGRRIVVNANATATVTLRDISIAGLAIFQSPLLLSNGATLSLYIEGTNTLSSGVQSAGIQVPANTTLTINCGTGTLIATGNNFGAGIGTGTSGTGGTNPVGEINIASGNVIARGGAQGSGIGGGWSNSGGVITISGGNVEAQGGNGGAGIGGGINGAGGEVTITAGNITARAGSNSASALGAGQNGTGGTVTVIGEYRFWTNTTTVDPGGDPTGSGEFISHAGLSFVRLERIVSSIHYHALDGQVRSYNPGNPTMIRLERTDGSFTYTHTIPAESGGSGQRTQNFTFQDIEPGTYSIVITKAGHTRFTINNVIVNGDVDLRLSPLAEVQTITLIPGDVDGNGWVNMDDVTLVMNRLGMSVGNLIGNEILLDIDGNGWVNMDDLSIVFGNLGRGEVIINMP